MAKVAKYSMLSVELFEAHDFSSPIDFNPAITRHLFDLDLAANRNVLTSQQHQEFARFLRQHRTDYIRLYHGTSIQHEVPSKGLLPTSATRRLSLQSGSGYVYLTYDPQRAVSFAMFGYPGHKHVIVYAVTVPIGRLSSDVDQLRNKRMWGERPDIGSTLADSFIYGGGARVRGKIDPRLISVHGVFDRNYHRVDDDPSS